MRSKLRPVMFCHGSNRVFSPLRDILLHCQKSHAVDLRPAITCCSSRNYSHNAVVRNPITTENELSSASKFRETFTPFPSMIAKRRREARGSIIVEVQDVASCYDLENYCGSIGPIDNVFYYSFNKKSYVLVEFKEEESKEIALQKAGYSVSLKIVPATSTFLWFKQKKDADRASLSKSSAVRDVTNDTLCDDEKIMNGLHDLTMVEDQINYLHKSYQISDFSIRLRFLTCNQIERALGGLFPHARALPFGSSVSGFGRNSADLDIFLQFLAADHGQKADKHRLMFHSKSWKDDTNLQLKLVGDIISVMLPGCTNVCSIMGARVPIIKYKQIMTNMECDVQNSSGSGVDMTHLLWIMHHWDHRVAPLVYTLRYWAKMNNITDDKPSASITNFSLVILIIFFLQSENVLPTLNFLEKLANPKTSVRYDDATMFHFLQDIRQVSPSLWKNCTQSTVEILLLNFFLFYSEFDFESKSVSILNGKVNLKPDSRPMWIVNPISPSLNIAHNVNKKAVHMFQLLVKDSRSLLEAAMNSVTTSGGLLSIIPESKKLKKNSVTLAASNKQQSRRMKTFGSSRR